MGGFTHEKAVGHTPLFGKDAVAVFSVSGFSEGWEVGWLLSDGSREGTLRVTWPADCKTCWGAQGDSARNGGSCSRGVGGWGDGVRRW